ncbi:hypothetical protein [Bacteroides salyersiae]|nr:hypothetical protein [Bacteroides salyersiae]
MRQNFYSITLMLLIAFSMLVNAFETIITGWRNLLMNYLMLSL